MADGRTGLGSQYGLFRSGGSRHRRQRLRSSPQGTATIHYVLPFVEPADVRHLHCHQLSPALLARRQRGDSARCLALFRHYRLLRHLLPDGRAGRLDAEMFGQHEGALDAEHSDVCDGRRLQLPIYIYTEPRRDGCCHRNGSSRADNGMPHVLFPHIPLRHAEPERPFGIVQAQKRRGDERLQNRSTNGIAASADGLGTSREHTHRSALGHHRYCCPLVGNHRREPLLHAWLRYRRSGHHLGRTELRSRQATADTLVCTHVGGLRHRGDDGDGCADVRVCTRADVADDARGRHHPNGYDLSSHRSLR